MPERGVLVMGVLNVTPDSFSDGGSYLSAEAAVAHGRRLVELGADIVDVGGESTRPGAEPVPREEELRRVLPVVRALAAEGIAVSIDTLHAETAQAAVAAGARYINDVSGGLHDPAMHAAAAWASAEHGASYIIGHWRGIPDPRHERSGYDDVVAEVRDALAGLAREAIAAGVDPNRIVIDPGLGFDKTGEQCWELLRRLHELSALGHRVLVGASRKRMIAEALAAGLGRTVSPEQRDLATAVVSTLVARAGAWGVRVHDVDATAQALAVERAWSGGDPSPPAAAPEPARSPDPSPVPAPEPTAAPEPAVRDRITLTGLEVFAHHGVFDFERERGQRFLIDAEVEVDLRPAAAGDALERTVHYGELADAIVEAVRRDPVDLIETLAERVAQVALGFPGVREASITVHKPDAPIDAVFSDVSVSIVRGQGGRW
ncbi:dihydropteroate synthase [Leucobacter ruminantium]|nr:dihydropteroate synthase [Leucobacter ruminantium]